MAGKLEAARQDTSVDQPLFSVYFMIGNRAWSWVCVARIRHGDGESTGHRQDACASRGDKAGPNLYRIFGQRGRTVHRR